MYQLLVLFLDHPPEVECGLLKPRFSLLGFFIGVSSGVLISNRTVISNKMLKLSGLQKKSLIQ